MYINIYVCMLKRQLLTVGKTNNDLMRRRMVVDRTSTRVTAISICGGFVMPRSMLSNPHGQI